MRSLLVASHIIPWSRNEEHRLDPLNGIALNSLHDKAFDAGLITFDENFRLEVISKCFWKASARDLAIRRGVEAAHSGASVRPFTTKHDRERPVRSPKGILR